MLNRQSMGSEQPVISRKRIPPKASRHPIRTPPLTFPKHSGHVIFTQGPFL
jgi:hypothetical protein